MKVITLLSRPAASRVFAVALSAMFITALAACNGARSSKRCRMVAAKCSGECTCKTPCKNPDGTKKCAADCKKPCCAKTDKSAQAAANSKCPMSGKAADPAVTVAYGDQTVAFCCGGCIDRWQKLSDDEKSAKLAAAK